MEGACLLASGLGDGKFITTIVSEFERGKLAWAVGKTNKIEFSCQGSVTNTIGWGGGGTCRKRRGGPKKEGLARNNSRVLSTAGEKGNVREQ